MYDIYANLVSLVVDSVILCNRIVIVGLNELHTNVFAIVA